MLFFLAFRNIVRMRRRYFFVALAVALGFAMATIVSGAAFGALDAMKGKAARYFAGEVSVQGFHDPIRSHQRIERADELAEELARNIPSIRLAIPRNIYYGDDATLIFGGETVRQRRLVGVDFARDAEEFSGLSFVEGSLADITRDASKSSILISEAAASILRAHVGDDVTLSLLTDRGQYNSGTLVVRGIFQETSLFGYVAYLPLDTLNLLTARPVGAATDIAVYGHPGTLSVNLAEMVRVELSRTHTVFPPLATKDAVDAALASGVSAQVYAVLPLEGNLSQMQEIMSAFLAITYTALFVFVCIVMIGILNTFRVIAHERTTEVGTLRAIGMQRSSVLSLFMLEALYMSLAAILVGLVLSFLGFGLLSFVDLGRIPAAGLFTVHGKMHFQLDPLTTVLDFFIMVAATVVAAAGPARKASRIDPAAALRMEA